jgi:tetratricopeptide (TPR) repeat protein
MDGENMIDRIELIRLIEAARIAGRLDFARAIASDWLEVWAGDMELQLRLAQIEIDQTRYGQAIVRLSKLTISDPENTEAYQTLAAAQKQIGNPLASTINQSCADLLEGKTLDTERSPSWAIHLMHCLEAIRSGDHETAITKSQEALAADPDTPLPVLIAIQAHQAADAEQIALALARTGHDRWPDCIAFRIFLANDLLNRGDSSRGVAYLHQAAVDDPLGSVTTKIMGTLHPYQALWTNAMTMKLTSPVPADVSAVLGENKLGGSNPTRSAPSSQVTDSEIPLESHQEMVQETTGDDITGAQISDSIDGHPIEPLKGEAFQGPSSGEDSAAEDLSIENSFSEVEADFNRIAERINARRQTADEDRRFPAYIVLSSRAHLMQTFGDDSFNQIDKAIVSLIDTIRKRPGWTAYHIYIDDPSSFENFKLQPADPANAWQIKLRLSDLDQALQQRGEMIGALLIVGGDRIIPFHRLPNPVDDDDDYVFSDNPYATTDENYFAPQWAIGRLPSGDSAELIIRQIKKITEDHSIAVQNVGILTRIRVWLYMRFARFARRKPRSLGYTASIWRKASMAVYKSIGEPGSLLTSPPAQASQIAPIITNPFHFSYFNLHGLEDAPEWFGQRDPLMDTGSGPDFPVAFRPEDVVNSGRAPKVIYSEACYGANIEGKSIDSALCLKFLDSGTRAFVGSTKVSYGSVTTPLIAADLLGHLFWNQLNKKITAGESLRRAKLQLAAEMHRRQGYLDGEDQKTLISFVLFGDPLFNPTVQVARPGQKLIVRRKSRPKQMKTVCALGVGNLTDLDDPAEIDRVKTIVSKYLPGMADAQCRIHPQPIYGCEDSQHQCPSNQLGIKRLVAGEQSARVYTFAKHVVDGSRRHAHYARLTLDSSGKVLKFSVSR